MSPGTTAARPGGARRAEVAQEGAHVLFDVRKRDQPVAAPLQDALDALVSGPISSAATITLLAFGGLTAVVMITRKDFSFLRGLLVWGGILALVAIVSAVIFGFQLGTWFMVAMIGFAGAAVLYDTSNILHHYPKHLYVAASLELFSSIALMFWYVLQFFMSRD